MVIFYCLSCLHSFRKENDNILELNQYMKSDEKSDT